MAPPLPLSRTFLLCVSLRHYSVVHPDFDNYEVLKVTEPEAERMVHLNQARWIRGGRALRLSHHYQMPATGGRTRTSRGGMLAAIGRSQVYTIADARGRVTDFKHLDHVDRYIFESATRECMSGGA